MDWSASGEKTSLVCNFCNESIKLGEKVYCPDDQSLDIIVHQSCRKNEVEKCQS